MIFGFLLSNYSQHVIKVKKGQTIQGLFSLNNEDKTYDYLYFTEDGQVLMLMHTTKKPKKAIPYLAACSESATCSDVQTKEYTFEKNVISFSFQNGKYIKSYDGMFEENGTKMVIKISETDEIVIVKEFVRLL